MQTGARHYHNDDGYRTTNLKQTLAFLCNSDILTASPFLPHDSNAARRQEVGPTLSVVFARESLTPELWAEAVPLLVAHWAEVAHYPDIPLSPDVAIYQANEDAGVLRVFTARDYDLVGYALYLVHTAPQARHSIQAVCDVIYVRPESRGWTGPTFMRWVDAQLAAEGVQVTYHHVPAQHDFSHILERMGYEPVDIVLAKRLDQPPIDRPSAIEGLDEAFV